MCKRGLQKSSIWAVCHLCVDVLKLSRLPKKKHLPLILFLNLVIPNLLSLSKCLDFHTGFQILLMKGHLYHQGTME